jgi:hypothetical protein
MPWPWQIIFLATAVIFLADAFTRNRPDILPSWLGGLTAGVGFNRWCSSAGNVVPSHNRTSES